MIIIPKPDTECQNCIWAHYQGSIFIYARRFICGLNPFKKVHMGLDNVHSQRKTNIEKQKKLKEILKRIR